MSHALLLRLFLSPSFFSVHVALHYLKLYPDNIGITYYLTRRLSDTDPHDLRDAWGFICHLLITRPSKSRALECFVVEMSEQSTHLAMFTLWFMQACLKDLASSRSTEKSFTICQRVLHRCHELIFADLPPTPSPYSALKLPSRVRFGRTKVKAHIEPVIVGIGCLLAGAPALPTVANIVGAVAIEQGRLQDDLQSMRSVETRGNERVPDAVTRPVDSPDDIEDEDDAPTEPSPAHPERSQSLAENVSPPEDRGLSLNRRQTISAAQTSPALPLNKAAMRLPRASDDPFGQLDAFSQPPSATPYQSSPSVSTIKRHYGPSSASVVDALLQQYDLNAQRYLLQSHYCRSEIQFILALENISNRLLVVPKPARVSALRAELTSLNHNLPAEVCMPMWCESSDSPTGPENTPIPHHRIVRIPPGESVVLNSAEHAPYLLVIEILNSDLDFDPTKRGNKDVLKKILTKDRNQVEAMGLKKGTQSTNQAASYGDQLPGEDAALGTEAQEASIDTGRREDMFLSRTSSNMEGDDEEEVDLVEQLYGADLSIRHNPDLSENLVLPPAPKNKALDAVAWSRSSSIPPSPAITPTPSYASSRSDLPDERTAPVEPERPLLSLDEYSERMRTAAVMLAQLNANLVKETVMPVARPMSANPEPGAGVPGWLSTGKPGAASTSGGAAAGPLHPSLSGTAAPVAGASMRMKLQPAEAAAIRDRIMQEMLALEEARMERMRESNTADGLMSLGGPRSMKTAEDETIIRRELNKVDPSAVVFQESWAAKKSRIRQGSPYGHLASWDCASVIVKTGGDLRQEQLAVQMIREFASIWQEENCACWVRYFRILITGGSSGLVETITDAVSIHSIKKAEYARRLAEGRLGHVTLLDHFVATYGDPSSAKFARAQRNFAKSLAGYSIVTYLLQIKDRHNGNILLDRDGHLVHIDFGFMLSNSPGNIGFEAAPFKLPFEYVEVLGGLDSPAYLEFKRLFRHGFEAARKHCDRIITIVELMQKDSHLPCFAALGEQTAQQLRERFQPALTRSTAGDYIERLIMSSLGSNWTRLYDSFQYYSQSIL